MFYWDPNPDLIIIPFLNWPIKWYGVFFAVGFGLGFVIFEKILYRYFLQNPQFQSVDNKILKSQAFKLTDQITLYIVLATIIGARLGHFLFYERPSEYLRHPLEILEMWKGGLASHGAAIAIILALMLFSRRVAKKIDPTLKWIRLLDFICVPTALAGALIRCGNFVNQEILGTPTDLAWGVIFGHPADGGPIVARHPVQLYEALFYFCVFLLLWRLTFRPAFLLHQGRLIGLFLILIFGFRFVIEFFKLEQSQLLSTTHAMTMGQYLSIPLILVGGYFLAGREIDGSIPP